MKHRIEQHLRRLVHIGYAAIVLLLVWFALDVIWNVI